MALTSAAFTSVLAYAVLTSSVPEIIMAYECIARDCRAVNFVATKAAFQRVLHSEWCLKLCRVIYQI